MNSCIWTFWNTVKVEVNKTKYMVMSRDHNSRQSRNIKMDNSSFERVVEFK